MWAGASSISSSTRRTPDTVYAAASGGGVWKSTDAGMTWRSSLADERDADARGAGHRAGRHAVGRHRRSEPVRRRPDLLRQRHLQVDRRRRHLAALGSGRQRGHRPHRRRPDRPEPRLRRGGRARSPQSVSQRGIYRVDNGGKDWKLVLAPPNDTTGGIDLAIDPANHNRVYAALWDHKRNNGARVYGGVGSGLFRSDNGGDTWTRLENIVGPVPDYDQTGTGLHADASLGRIGIGIAPSRPQPRVRRVRLAVRAGQGLLRLQRRRRLVHARRPSRRVRRVPVVVRPAVGRSDEPRPRVLRRREPARVHRRRADVAQLQRSARRPARDGVGPERPEPRLPRQRRRHVPLRHQRRPAARGSTRRTSRGTSRTTSRWRPTTRAGWRPGCRTTAACAPGPRRREPSDLSQWNAYGGGDGHEVLIDPSDHNVYYECFQVGNCHRHEDVGGVSQSLQLRRPALDAGSPRTRRSCSTRPTPTSCTSAATCCDRSTDRGATFTQISPPGDYLTGPVPPDENDLGPFYANEYATISWIAPAKTDGNTIYVGTDTGRVWKTTDLGANWTELSGNGLPQRWVNAIVVDPTDANHVYAAFSGYREGDNAANVYETTDGGATWQNISGNLPNAPVEMITYDQSHTSCTRPPTSVSSTSRTARRTGRGSAPACRTRRCSTSSSAATDTPSYAATFGRSVVAASDCRRADPTAGSRMARLDGAPTEVGAPSSNCTIRVLAVPDGPLGA